MILPRQPDDPGIEPASVQPDISSLFWTAFIAGIVLTAIVVGGVVLAVMWGQR